uniref:Uncharacterized protein n=1 Tax=Romanomermis culicivorax TaxID=13658 RepID=A0A915JZJ9_ROMCU
MKEIIFGTTNFGVRRKPKFAVRTVENAHWGKHGPSGTYMILDVTLHQNNYSMFVIKCLRIGKLAEYAHNFRVQ